MHWYFASSAFCAWYRSIGVEGTFHFPGNLTTKYFFAVTCFCLNFHGVFFFPIFIFYIGFIRFFLCSRWFAILIILFWDAFVEDQIPSSLFPFAVEIGFFCCCCWDYLSGWIIYCAFLCMPCNDGFITLGFSWKELISFCRIRDRNHS